MTSFLELLSRDVVSLVVAPLMLTAFLGALVLALALLSRRPGSSLVSAERYEAGNPPWGSARRPLEMQYVAYLVLFATIEPVLVVTGFLALAGLIAAPLFIAFLLLLSIPVLVYGAYEARRVSVEVAQQ
ncbi:MAG: hypothetical protein QXS85_04595 [Acidilobaceae archaeon]